MNKRQQSASIKPAICPSCKQPKQPSDYAPSHVTCRECNSAYHKRHRMVAPEAYRAADKRWTQNNMDKVNAKNTVRKNRLAQTSGVLTLKQTQALRMFANNACMSCSAIDDLTVDHVIPITLGGTHDLENRQILCRACNARKGQQSTDYRDPVIFAAFLVSIRGNA